MVVLLLVSGIDIEELLILVSGMSLRTICTSHTDVSFKQ